MYKVCKSLFSVEMLSHDPAFPFTIANTVTISHMCLVSTWNMARVTEELYFTFYFILSNFHFNLET